MKAIVIIFLFGITLLMCSCSRMLTPDTKAEFYGNHIDGHLYTYSPYQDLDDPTKGELKDTSVLFELDNHSPYYTIYHQKEGYFDNSYIIHRDEFNPYQLLDWGLLTSFCISSLIQPPMLGGASIYVVYFMPHRIKKRFSKHHELPLLVRYPKPLESKAKISIKSIDLELEENTLQFEYYNSYERYFEKKITSDLSFPDSKFVKDLAIKSDINKFLAELNYLDTNNFFNNFNKVQIECEIKRIKQIQVESNHKIIAEYKWKVHHLMDNSKDFSISDTATSIWYSKNDDYNMIDDFSELTIKSLSKVIDCKAFQTIMKETNFKTFELSKEYKKLELLSNKNYPNSIDNAIKATVSILTNKGFGSGFCISEDGYILSNHHVINNVDSASIKIKLNDGSIHPAIIIRSNEYMDLTLLKIEVENLRSIPFHRKYFKPLTTEIVAIGTPEEISLSQSLSKGIISGIRDQGSFNFYQTDASLNSGNSGGPMIDTEGNLIGIISLKMTGFTVEGIGFAIPSLYLEEALRIKIN